MIYFLISIALCISLNINKKKDSYYLFLFNSLFILVFACIRYGSGTDYFAYEHIYKIFGSNFNDYHFYAQSVEPGYGLLNILGKKSGVSFQLFIGVLSFLSLLFFFHTIIHYSNNFLFSLFIFFVNYYIPYFSNQWRQGFAMIFGLYIIINYINKPKKALFFIQVILLSLTFHFSILSLLLIPLFDKLFSEKFIFSFFKVFRFSILCFLFSFIFLKFLPLILSSFDNFIITKLINYAKEMRISLPSIAVRAISVFLIMYLSGKKIQETKDLYLIKLYRIFIYGFFVYLCVSQVAIFSRFSDHYAFIEVILIPNILCNKKIKNKSRTILKYSFILLYFLLFLKDCNDATYQGNYIKQGCFSYPYTTVFNKDSIFEYREIESIYLD